MTTINVIFHGVSVANGDPLIYTQLVAEGTREEVAKSLVNAMTQSDVKSIVLSSNDKTTVINKNHVAMIEVSD